MSNKKKTKTKKSGKKKKKKKKTKKKESKKKKKKKPSEYYEAVGRRKTATARVRLFTKGKKKFLVNGESYQDYFPTLELKKLATASIRKMNCEGKFRITALAKGGGLHGQAEAIRHGTARALVKLNPSFKKRLRRAGYLTRDPRMKERKKPGLRGARRAPQWQKR